MMDVLEHCTPQRLPRPPARDVERTMKEIPLSVGLLAWLWQRLLRNHVHARWTDIAVDWAFYYVSFRESKSNFGIVSSQSSKYASLKPSLEPMYCARQSPDSARLQSLFLRRFSKSSQCPGSVLLSSCVTHVNSPTRSRTNMPDSASTFLTSRLGFSTAERPCKRTSRRCRTKTLTHTLSLPHLVD